MSKRKIALIFVIAILPFLIIASRYSFLRYQKILHNESIAHNTSCGKARYRQCAYEIVPPSLWEIITRKKTGKMLLSEPCDPVATTTDCSKIVDVLPPPTVVATTSANQIQSGKIDEHLTINNTLRDVDFCGKTYRVKQVIIDGVDVVQRIAELVRDQSFSQNTKIKTLSDDICGSVPFNPQDEVQVEEAITFTFDASSKNAGEKTGTYGIYAQIFQVGVNPTKNEIYSIDGFDGSTELIGKLK